MCNDSYKKLCNGYKNFYDREYVQHKELFENLSDNQNPETLVISCSDSRVDTSYITSSKPGEVFCIRNVANLVPPYEESFNNYHGTSSAIEYAVKCLKVKNIIILGHSDCGGIKALVENQGSMNCGHEFIDHWVDIAKPAVEKTNREKKDAPLSEQIKFCEFESIKSSLDNLLTFPFVKKAIDNNELAVYGWYFEIASGKLLSYDKDSMVWSEVREDEKKRT